MIQSVWLTKLLQKILNEPGNALSVSHENVRRVFAAEEDLILLLEPDRSLGSVLYAGKDTAVILSEDLTEKRAEQLKKAAACREVLDADNDLCIPLRLSQTDVFAVLVFPGKAGMRPDEAAENAVDNFAAFLYSEGMGGILVSGNPTVVSVKDLEVTYHNGNVETKAVRGISFDICKNELAVIEGASGCGKSSLLNCVGGMLTPSAGSILFHGKDVAKMSRSELSAYRRDSVGFIFQHYNLIADLTAEENVAIAAGISKGSMTVEESLRLVGMEKEASRYPNQLSGGQQQRVCIARAIVKHSDLLICDEPTGALDTENSSQVIRILQDLAKKQGIAVIMITHNPLFSLIADHCFKMSDGLLISETRQPFPLPAKDLQLK